MLFYFLVMGLHIKVIKVKDTAFNSSSYSIYNYSVLGCADIFVHLIEHYISAQENMDFFDIFPLIMEVVWRFCSGMRKLRFYILYDLELRKYRFPPFNVSDVSIIINFTWKNRNISEM